MRQMYFISFILFILYFRYLFLFICNEFDISISILKIYLFIVYYYYLQIIADSIDLIDIR